MKASCLIWNFYLVTITYQHLQDIDCISISNCIRFPTFCPNRGSWPYSIKKLKNASVIWERGNFYILSIVPAVSRLCGIQLFKVTWVSQRLHGIITLRQEWSDVHWSKPMRTTLRELNRAWLWTTPFLFNSLSLGVTSFLFVYWGLNSGPTPWDTPPFFLIFFSS
jgi:hypothetical protein